MILRLQQQSGNQAVQRLLSTKGSVQRKAAGRNGGELDSGLQSQIESVRGGGQTLDKQAASSFGDKLGADFSNVRIHTDAQADTLSRSLNATAFTTSNDIFFAKGAYNPSSSGGQRLLAHELTHVVQQGGGKANKIQTKLKAGAANDGFEQEASQVASAVAKAPTSTQSAQTTEIKPGTSGTIQRNVGFEFEVPLYPAYRLNKNLTIGEKTGLSKINKDQLTHNELRKSLVLARDTGFELQLDEGSSNDFHLEFVTTGEGFPETKGGQANLEQAMTNMENMGNSVITKLQKSWIKLNDTEKSKPPLLPSKELKNGNSTTPEILIRSSSAGSMEASPQTTAGIRLDQLPTLVDKMMEMFSSNKKTNKTTSHPLHYEATNMDDLKAMQNANAQARKAVKGFKEYANNEKIELPPKFGSEALIGLVALIYTYLKKAETTEVNDYPKSLFPILGISNFSAMFEMLPDDDQLPFKKEPKQFTSINLKAAEMPGTDDTGFFTKGFAKKLSHLTEKETELTANQLGSITRGEWLAGIPLGKDILSRTGFQQSKDSEAPAFESMGKYSYGETVGQESQGNESDTRIKAPILELRRMAPQIPLKAWKPLALQVFDYMVKLNNLEIEKSNK